MSNNFCFGLQGGDATLLNPLCTKERSWVGYFGTKTEVLRVSWIFDRGRREYFCAGDKVHTETTFCFVLVFKSKPNSFVRVGKILFWYCALYADSTVLIVTVEEMYCMRTYCYLYECCWSFFAPFECDGDKNHGRHVSAPVHEWPRSASTARRRISLRFPSWSPPGRTPSACTWPGHREGPFAQARPFAVAEILGWWLSTQKTVRLMTASSVRRKISWEPGRCHRGSCR